jgi:hypothetical protein
MTSSMNPSVIASAQRLVVKVGSSLVTNEGRGLDHARLALWSEQISALTERGQGSRPGQQRRHRRGHQAPGLEANAPRP